MKIPFFRQRVIERVALTERELVEAFAFENTHPLYRGVVAVIQQHAEDAKAALFAATTDEGRASATARMAECDELLLELDSQIQRAKPK